VVQDQHRQVEARGQADIDALLEGRVGGRGDLRQLVEEPEEPLGVELVEPERTSVAREQLAECRAQVEPERRGQPVARRRLRSAAGMSVNVAAMAFS